MVRQFILNEAFLALCLLASIVCLDTISLEIALEAPKLELVTLEARNMKVVLILEEQVEVMFKRMSENVHIARTVLEYSDIENSSSRF